MLKMQYYQYSVIVFIILMVLALLIVPILYTNLREYRTPIFFFAVFVVIVFPIIIGCCCELIYFRPPIQGGSPFHKDKCYDNNGNPLSKSECCYSQ